MIAKQDIVNAVNKIKAIQKNPKRKRLINPERDWFVLLSLALVLVGVVMVWTVLSFIALEKEGQAAPDTVENVPKYQDDLLQEIIKIKS